MANGQTVMLSSLGARAQAKRLIEAAPHGSIVNVREAKRTNEQNDLMWALLSDISRAKPQGRTLAPDLWKCLFMASIGHKVRFEPDLDGEGVVPIGFHSSRLTKAQMSDLIEAIFAFGAVHNVAWSNEERAAA